MGNTVRSVPIVQQSTQEVRRHGAVRILEDGECGIGSPHVCIPHPGAIRGWAKCSVASPASNAANPKCGNGPPSKGPKALRYGQSLRLSPHYEEKCSDK